VQRRVFMDGSCHCRQTPAATSLTLWNCVGWSLVFSAHVFLDRSPLAAHVAGAFAFQPAYLPAGWMEVRPVVVWVGPVWAWLQALLNIESALGINVAFKYQLNSFV